MASVDEGHKISKVLIKSGISILEENFEDLVSMEQSKEKEQQNTLVKTFDSSTDRLIRTTSIECSINYLGTVKAMKIVLKSGATYCCCWEEQKEGESLEPRFCQAEHIGVVVEGSLIVEDAEGNKRVINKGECYLILPGHRSRSQDSSKDAILYEFDMAKDKPLRKHPHNDGADFDGVLSSEESTLTSKSFDVPDDVEIGKDGMFVAAINNFESVSIQKTVGKPGASWIEHIQPAETQHADYINSKSCVSRHIGFLDEGTLQITMDNKQEFIVHEGDAFMIEPGHNTMVISEYDAVFYEFML